MKLSICVYICLEVQLLQSVLFYLTLCLTEVDAVSGSSRVFIMGFGIET